MSNSTDSWSRFDRRERLLRFFGLLAGLVILVAAWRAMEVNYGYAVTAPRELADLFGRMYPPNVGYSREIVGPLLETINISILGTALAIVMAIPVAFLGASNTSPNKPAYLLGKFIISFTRSVNVIIWALIFVVIFGPGALAGVLAISIRSIGFTAKLIAEAIEEIDRGSVEAITAAGASPIDVLIYSIVPQIKPAFISVATLRWDINVRASTIIGFVGAGGIGVPLQTEINYFNWEAVLTILISILGLVLISEAISAYLRKKVM
ncbi:MULTISPECIES: phosphonate ABC transporter, permease protein PhnE [Haloarcula]|jgi:phosphonate transport system permease protein|uniref:Phosphonate ABC transporter permease n=1 Tax=Haloarcula amylolytica JCM 13557 TaxID=1227452 RepID=M0KSE2_9EURY|nr:phosphonate ABC transporter, permease protein PhnE [Haloarcula amylolytica]EMA23843.1 phosphonate ABC transporter permease [Haloarcula amylolytica JCM 13557]